MARRLSEEHKAKLRAGRLAAQAKETEVKDIEEVATQQITPQVPTIDPQLIATIVATVQALQAQNPQLAQATPEQKLDETAKNLTAQEANMARISNNGVQGMVFKYSIDEDDYDDPTERLYDDPKLKRHAMRENYIFRWAVDGITYEKHGVTYSEPRFTVELYRRLFDDDGEPLLNPKTGHPTMALVARQYQHEDPLTTRVAAMRMGILDKYANTPDGFNQLMTEIRFHRFREWLLAIFSKAKITTFNRKPRTMNVGGTIVEVFDTEKLTDPESAAAKAATVSSEVGIGNIKVPE